MFQIACFIGLYAYAIQVVGLLGLLTPLAINLVTVIFSVSYLYLIRKKLVNYLVSFKPTLPRHPLTWLIILEVIVIAIGGLAPEINFDALWYHLTLPKIYLSLERIKIFTTGIPWIYSGMPALTEMLYTAALSLSNEIAAKSIHAIFSLLISLQIYRFSVRRINLTAARWAVVILLADLNILWLSATANVDLVRAFYETAGWIYLLEWLDQGQPKDALKSGVMTGLAMSVKSLSLGTAGIIGLLMFTKTALDWRKSRKLKIENFKAITLFGAASVLSGGFWYVKNWIITGNPIFPVLTQEFSQINQFPLPGHIFDFFQDMIRLSGNLGGWDASMSPIYLILIPLVIFSIRCKTWVRWLLAYCFLYYLVWFFIPRSGGARFMAPLAPALSVICVTIFIKPAKKNVYQKIAATLIIIVSVFNLSLRFIMIEKNLPVIFKLQTKNEFLKQNLDGNNTCYDSSDIINQSPYSQGSIAVKENRAYYYCGTHLIPEGDIDNQKDYLLQSLPLSDVSGFKKLVYKNSSENIYLFGR